MVVLSDRGIPPRILRERSATRGDASVAENHHQLLRRSLAMATDSPRRTSAR